MRSARQTVGTEASASRSITVERAPVTAGGRALGLSLERCRDLMLEGRRSFRWSRTWSAESPRDRTPVKKEVMVSAMLFWAVGFAALGWLALEIAAEWEDD
jgi:hypothetical protein